MHLQADLKSPKPTKILISKHVNMNNGLIIKTPPLDVYEQMAADEIMCNTLPANFILRFYNWTETSITFGYSQRYAIVIEFIGAEKQKIKSIVRRPTGGGIVFHKTDLTFSFIFYSPGIFNPAKTYRCLHDSISREYLKSGFNLELLDGKNCNYNINNPVMDCFSKPVPMDILYNGKKVFGGALRKFDNYILYQASVQFENARNNSAFHSQIIANALSKEFEINWTSVDISQTQLEKIKELALLKYKTIEWNKRI